MTLDRIRQTLITAICTLIASLSTCGIAHANPAECKPDGNSSCAPARPTAYEYEVRMCSANGHFDSEQEAAAFFFASSTPYPGCPASIVEWLGWAQNERSNCSGSMCTPPDATFSIQCPGEGSGPYPYLVAGFDVGNFSLYRVTTFTGPTCSPFVYDRPPNGDTLAAGPVMRTADIVCPEGYDLEGVGTDKYCARNDGDYDAGKNLGCAKPAEGQCKEGNPINVGTGNKYQIESDYSGSGPNPLQFTRVYNSHSARTTAPNGFHRISTSNSAEAVFAFKDPDQPSGTKAMAAESIGVNWRHSYQRGVVEITTSTLRSAMLYRQDGQVYIFVEHSGSWVADADVNYVVTELTSGGVTTGWEVKTPSDSTETYNALGQLLTIADRAGVTTTVFYDSVGRIDKVADQFGRELDFGYAAEPQPGEEWWEDPSVVNRITSVTDPAGNMYSYDYNSNGTLKTVTYPGNDIREYRYEDSSYPFALTAIIDGNQEQFATFGYDSEGRANLSYHGQGADIAERVDVTYTKTGTFAPYYSVASTDVTFGQGSPQAYSTSTTIGRKLGIAKMNGMTHGSVNEARTYDSRGNVERHTDLNGITSYSVFNSRNLRTLLREAENDPLERDTTYTWHPTYRLPDVITEPNRTVDFDYFTNGDVQRVTITSLNSSGSEDLSTDGHRTRIWNYQYNAYGQVTSIDGPRVDVSDVTTLDYYDDPTCPVGDGKCGQLEFVVDAAGNRTDFNEYYDDGRLKTMTDQNGLVTQYEYNGRRHLTKVTVSDGATSRITQYSYDAASQIDAVTFPNGLILDYEWTSAHLLDYVEDNFGNRIDYEYDALGNTVAENRRDPAGVIRNAMSTTYDDHGFVDTVTSGTLGSGNAITTDFDYDPEGNLDKITDADLNVTDYLVDSLNRAHKVIDALQNDSDFGFDSQDNVTLVAAPNGATTSLPHDGLGNLDKEFSPDRGAIDYDYDDAGNLRYKLDALGLETQYAYDALNRLTTVTLDGGGTIVYQYDDGSVNAKGRLRKIIDSTGETSWTYNRFGDVTTKTQKVGAASLTTEYQYHADGQVEWMKLPSGKTIYYGYDVFLPDSVTVDSETILDNAQYEPFGPVKAWTWGNAMASTRNFDTRGLLVGQTMLTYSRVLGYDSLGRLSSLEDGRPPAEIDYGELVPESGYYTNTLLPYSNQLDEVPGPISKDYDYDAAGNVVADGVHTFDYDDRGRLSSVDGGSTATYAHNAQGQRVSRIRGGITTLFAYDDAGNLVGEYDSSGTPVQEHVWFSGTPVAVLSGSDVFYVHTDHLGTPRAISDGSIEIWRWVSTPFGDTAADEDPDDNSVPFAYNLRFPGQYYDDETGLHYNYFRTYDPTTGRYLESDPIGLAAGPNTYSYVENMPTMHTDSLGLANDNSVCGGLPPKYQVACYRDRANPRPNKDNYDFYTEVGGCLFGACVESRISSRSANDVLLAPELVGGGFSFCMEVTPDLESCPISDVAQPESIFDNVDEASLGMGRRLGVTVNSNKLCVNIGLGLGSPISPAHSLGEKPFY